MLLLVALEDLSYDEAARVLDSVLAYSRIEEGDGCPLELQVFTIDDLMIELGPHLERRALLSGFEIVYPDSHGFQRVRTDLRMVEHVLMNLVDNCCKYAATSEDRRIVLSAAPRAGAVDLHVEDFGPGIAGADRRRVFHAFERGTPHASGTIPGVGLGLALAKVPHNKGGVDAAMASLTENSIKSNI